MKVTLCGLLIAFCIRVRLYGRSCVLFCSLIFVNGLLVLKRVSNGLNAQVKTSNVEANSIQFNSIYVGFEVVRVSLFVSCNGVCKSCLSSH